eukprot:Blabericola_migrator_1__4534@NODE_2413_length_2801_cov_72_776518_g1512_i0_p1_GENE_NODE_2413_length_2801_cov_72_776518_g1512_i0NODE_2413_length_2801_cov_72_776518_g1512_i0_p1_ORF_typecomplete_len477_score36_89_NODE_2413_length_2801_cov_72_776518_g1512_i07742204
MRGIAAKPQRRSSTCKVIALTLIAGPPLLPGTNHGIQEEPLDLRVPKGSSVDATKTGSSEHSPQDWQDAYLSFLDRQVPSNANANAHLKRSAQGPTQSTPTAKVPTYAEREDTVAPEQQQPAPQTNIATGMWMAFPLIILDVATGSQKPTSSTAHERHGNAHCIMNVQAMSQRVPETCTRDDLSATASFAKPGAQFHNHPEITSSPSTAAFTDGTNKSSSTDERLFVDSAEAERCSAVTSSETSLSCDITVRSNEALYKKHRVIGYRAICPLIKHQSFLREWAKKIPGSELIKDHLVFLRRCELHTLDLGLRQQWTQEAHRVCSQSSDREVHFIADFIKLMWQFGQRRSIFDMVVEQACHKNGFTFRLVSQQMALMCAKYPHFAEAIPKEVQRKIGLYTSLPSHVSEAMQHVSDTLPEVFKEPECGRWLQFIGDMGDPPESDIWASTPKRCLLRLLSTAGHIVQFMRELANSAKAT